jgi:hypothetical protein
LQCDFDFDRVPLAPFRQVPLFTALNLEGSFLARFPEGFEEELAIRVVLNDSLPMVAAARDVINGSGILEPRFASHSNTISR